MGKKIFSIFLLGFLLIGLTGCGNKKQEADNSANNAKNNENYVYSVSEKEMYVGNVPSKYGEVYSNPEEAMTTFSHDMFIRHTIEDEEIKESYLGFKYKNNLYYIKGSDSSIYEENQEKLKEIFGKANCMTYSYYMVCEDNNLNLTIKDDGYVGINDDGAYCHVFDNYARCKVGGMR